MSRAGRNLGGVKEAKINVELALNLAEFFKDKDKFEITLVRDKNGYNPIFLNYFNRERESIKEFVSKQKETMSGAYARGRCPQYGRSDSQLCSRRNRFEIIRHQ